MIQHNFESLEDLASYVEHLAEQASISCNRAKTQKEQHAYAHEASSLSYIVDVIRTSNLMKARFVLVDDDLEDARGEIRNAIGQLELIQEAIGFSKDNLQSKLDELSSK